MLGGFSCPWCGCYNANDAAACLRCGQRLPPAALAGVIKQLPPLVITKALLLVNVAVFALQARDAQGLGVNPLASMPASTLLRFGALANGLELSEPARLLAACFVHMSPVHILFNMAALVQLGRIGEETLGPARYLLTYLVSGFLGFVVSGAWYAFGEAGRPYITAGASGAIFGLTGLLVAHLVAQRDPRWKELLIQQLIYSFLMYYALKTNQAAHLGGLAVGLVMGLFFYLENPSWGLAPVWSIGSALGALVTLASLVLPHTSPIWREARAVEIKRMERRMFQEPRVDPQPRVDPPRADPAPAPSR